MSSTFLGAIRISTSSHIYTSYTSFSVSFLCGREKITFFAAASPHTPFTAATHAQGELWRKRHNPRVPETEGRFEKGHGGSGGRESGKEGRKRSCFVGAQLSGCGMVPFGLCLELCFTVRALLVLAANELDSTLLRVPRRERSLVRPTPRPVSSARHKFFVAWRVYVSPRPDGR